ncbi:hypothetical protein OZ411_15050 [Bradyrhizobium sp. Arg237L]|uniref:hypothetical protein n=1 Tax=Bradyrhizobium sp. Arg237L TaxID=3003352 RepID=UPI00249F4417|nr:hypothetical protein [Bradyrhizobium sp. Arg237L]MDI4234130.1 hypothetical protein [Bradyrhizobium sp. Arg237L]
MSHPKTENEIDRQAVQNVRTLAHYAIHFANRELVKRDWRDPVYVAARAALEEVALDLHRAKWLFGRIDGTYLDFAAPAIAADDLVRAHSGFNDVISRAKEIAEACRAEQVIALQKSKADRTRRGEIVFADDVPVVPTICPIVVLQGTNRDMGRQYAQQIIEIYGSWIFARQATRSFSADERAEMSRWEAELAKYMPEILEFAAGWAEGASLSGVPMTYEQVLAIWTGTRPFSTEVRPMAFSQADAHEEGITAAYLGVAVGPDKSVAEAADMCSGVCAWGSATVDGKLVAASTTDHDCTYQATIVAFPDRGNSFIYTPFSANGSIPILGRFFMGGHPGMNSKGVAYIHHGGANTGEPFSEWGYGVRRGPSTFHILQFAETADQARDMQLGWPVGDTAISLGTAGGLFADAKYGFSLEARSGSPDAPNPIVREATYDALGNSFEFLYANNNALSPRSGHLNAAPKQGYSYSLAGGWFTFDPAVIHSEPGGVAFRRLNTKNSEGRNRFHYRTMMAGYGRIDLEYMTALYRTGGAIPEGDFEAVCARWNAGEQWDCSPAHRSNAFTVVMRPDENNAGVYRGCVGPAARDLNCRDPGHGYYYHDETNAFWELILAASPQAVLANAEQKAAEDIQQATQALEGFDGCDAGKSELQRLLEEARDELAGGKKIALEASDRDQQLSLLSRKLRAATRAQVRASQVRDAVHPPVGLGEG